MGTVHDLPTKGADRRWQVGGYRFELDRTPAGYRWGVSGRGCGVGGHRSPIGALFAHARFAGLPWYRLPGYGRVYPSVQASLHRRGYCVLTRTAGPDGERWRCSWCQNRAVP